jgi:GH35 family endo-1,4-beta-xylanase
MKLSALLIIPPLLVVSASANPSKSIDRFPPWHIEAPVDSTRFSDTIRGTEFDFSDLTGLKPAHGLTARLSTSISVPRDTVVEASAGADWWMEIAVNDSVVLSTMESGNGKHLITMLNHPFMLPLQAGENQVVVRVKSGNAGWGLLIGTGSQLKRAREAELERQRLVDSLISRSGEKIDSLRKGTIVIRGKAGTKVSVRQKTHAFPFGTALSIKMFGEEIPESDRKRYLDTAAKYFNMGVHENALKWYATRKSAQGTEDFSAADTVYSWCEANGLAMRGHCLFWAVDGHVQDWVKGLPEDSLLVAVKKRARQVTAHYRGRITDFDLNNEMLHGSFYRDRLGDSAVAIMARAALAGNPEARLFVNDFAILSGKDGPAYIRQIRSFLDAGVPLGGIGCQGHFIGDMDLRHVHQMLDSLAVFGLPIVISEYDLVTEDEEKKARYLDAFYRICFSHPAVEGILMWGFWEGRHWRPKAALWKKDWSETPAARAYHELVWKEWWSRVDGTIGKDGTFTCRVFLGTHSVRVGGKDVEVTVSSNDVDKKVTVRQ